MSHRPSGRVVAVGDLAFRVLTDASGRDRGHPTVVLVHGIGVSHRYFLPLHRALAERTRVVSLDLPGFGGVPKPGRDLDVAAMAGAIGELLTALRLGPVVLVGHSMGAQWSVELAIQRPELVERVVAIGPVADRRHRSMLAQARALAVDSLGEAPWINQIVFTDYARCGIPWYLAQLRHMLAHPLEERVAALPVPLLVVRGDRDPIAGVRWSRELRDRAPVGALVHIPHSHHVAQHAAPRAVADAILAHATGRASAHEG
ncbi:alpha/beta fold hydrolase [Agrococcus beijingensis]|uniref:alpha/beta fold hydrolase n=1 Tax=Agrococcus beijingensis TaxID=3068634 RepID=UPI0027417E93|nr:alpha/beta fold hydrolase [Agrococcus sp. REN33]